MTIISTFETQEERKRPKLVFILFFLVGVLIILEIWVSHTIVTSGGKLSEIQKIQDAKRRENQQLEIEIASVSALSRIASESASIGLTPTKNIQYIH